MSDPTVITSVDKVPVYDSDDDDTVVAWNVTVNWTGGAAPYTAVQSTSPGFEQGVTTIGKELAGPSFQREIAKDAVVGGLFFSVTAGAVVSPSVQGMGYDPEPAPGAPVLPPVALWWGADVEVTAANLDPIPPANLTFLHRAAVRAGSVTVPEGSAYASAATFTIPTDARSSMPAVVGAHGRISPEGNAIFLSPPPSDVPQLSDIRGVVWGREAGNGHVFVAADNVVAEVDLFRTSPTSTVRVSSLAKPLISQVSDTGKVVMVDGVAGVGEILVMDASGGSASHFAMTTDTDFTRSITPVGIALSPDGKVAYVADAEANCVVRIPEGAGDGDPPIVDHWGGKSNFDFPVPVGMDVNVGGSVLVADNNGGGWQWELVDATHSSQGKPIGVDIRMLAVDREISTASTVRFLYSKAPAAEAFNLNEIDLYPGPDPQPPAYHGSIVYGSSSGYLLLAAEDDTGQPYPVTPRTPQRVIISRGDTLLPYTSGWQEEDRIIRFEITAWPGLEFRLRVIDPPDTAAYAPGGGWDMGRSKKLPYEGNDNAEDLAIAEVGLALDPAGPWSKELDVTPLGDRTVTVYLKVTGRNAGDNYQIEVTKCGPGGCAAEHLPERVVALSPIVTGWKRIHLERDRMFRRGGVLAEDYLIQEGTCGGEGQGPCCGQEGALPCDQIRVYEWSDVAVGDWIIVFDRSITSASSYAIDYFAPMRQVMQVGDPDADGLRVVTLDSPLSRNFRASPWVLEDPGVSDFRQPVFCDDNGENCHSSGLGVVSGCDAGSNQINAVDSCFFDVDLRGVELAFNDAFVEVYAPREGMSLLPYLPDAWFDWEDQYEELHPSSYPYPIDYFTWTWFENATQDPTNFRQVLGVSAASGGFEVGSTRRFSRRTLVFRQSIEWWGGNQDPPATVAQLGNFTQDTTDHEIGHQFAVQACSAGQHHNDETNPKPAWCAPPWTDPGVCPANASSPELCLMNNGDILMNNSQGWDAVYRFCEECLFLGDDQCSGSPADGAIRTEEDPLP